MLRGRRVPADRWTEQDHALAVALQFHEEDLCPDCGHPRSEAMDPLGDRLNGDGTHWYESPPPAVCHGCDAVAMNVQKVMGGEVKPARPQALRFHAERHERR